MKLYFCGDVGGDSDASSSFSLVESIGLFENGFFLSCLFRFLRYDDELVDVAVAVAVAVADELVLVLVLGNERGLF